MAPGLGPSCWRILRLVVVDAEVLVGEWKERGSVCGRRMDLSLGQRRRLFLGSGRVWTDLGVGSRGGCVRGERIGRRGPVSVPIRNLGV